MIVRVKTIIYERKMGIDINVHSFCEQRIFLQVKIAESAGNILRVGDWRRMCCLKDRNPPHIIPKILAG